MRKFVFMSLLAVGIAVFVAGCCCGKCQPEDAKAEEVKAECCGKCGGK